MSDDRLATLRRFWPLIALLVIVVLAASPGFWGSSVTLRTVITMLIDMVLVIGLYIFAGNSGILSFGHMSFMAFGAYATALVAIPRDVKQLILPRLPDFIAHSELGLVPAALVAVGVTAVLAVIISIPIMRLSGIAAALSMFAVLLIVHAVANNWEDVTRGRMTMFGVPEGTTLTVALLAALGAVLVAFVFQESRTGLRLRASREDDIAAQSIGVDITRARRLAFILSAMVVGAGGFLFAEFQTSFNPDQFYLGITFLTIAMLVVGGVNSLAGAVIGTIVITAVGELLRRIEEGTSIGPVTIPSRSGLREAGLAAIMLLILIFRPRGLTGGRELPWPSLGGFRPADWRRGFRRRRPAADDSDASAARRPL
jgi:branched-chain amino acid transport system permease protein